MKPFNLKQMGARYGILVQTALENNGNHTPTNLLSIINGQVYFPTYSNSLKSIALLAWLRMVRHFINFHDANQRIWKIRPRHFCLFLRRQIGAMARRGDWLDRN
jgi:hypothetical protein